MPKCSNCGRRGLFLKLNSRGLCPECAKKAAMAPKSSKIIISIDGVNVRTVGANYAAIGHEDEEKACNYFIEQLVGRGKDRSRFKIEHRSEQYTSLLYDRDDFIRIKMTANVKWISLALSNEDREKYMDSPLFAAQPEKDKNRHWHSYFHSTSDLTGYLDMAEHACVGTTYDYNRSLNANEKKVMDYLMMLFIGCGADPGKFYQHINSGDAELMYNSQFGNIRFKAYAKRPGGYLILDGVFESVGIRGEKDRYPFTDLSELNFLKEKLIPEKIKNGLDDKYSTDMKYFKKYSQLNQCDTVCL